LHRQWVRAAVEQSNAEEEDMTIRVGSGQLINPQALEAAVNGPDGANRLFVFTGAAPVYVGSSSQPGTSSTAKETFTWLLGPQLARRQFVKAVADASIAHWGTSANSPNPVPNFVVDLVEADWDDESQQVECRVEVRVDVQGGGIQVNRINYNVTVLAEIGQ
jgi:hypothetical protein